MPHYTLQFRSTDDDDNSFLERNANSTDVVKEIFDRYRNNGKIISSECTESNGTYTQVISFDNVTSYNEWYAEIDAVDTTPPAGVTYLGAGVYAD